MTPGLSVRVRETLRREGLVRRGDRVLAAVSGGGDSVALALLLRACARDAGFTLELVHLHHGLRGRAADADARFVRALARRLEAPFRLGRANVKALAARRGWSVEMAAREARLRFFRREMRRAGGAAIALAHTADDQAETVLLRLARGTSLRGLGGMSFRSDRAGVTLIRPLLDATREELRAYLRERGQRWREDASNRDPAHLRNRVRHDVLPALRRLNPRVVEAVTRAARWLREDEAELRASAMARARKGRADPEGGALDAVRLSRLPAPFRRRVWLRWLEARGAGGAAVDSALIERLDGLARLAPGPAEAPVPGGWIARLGGSEVRLVRRKAAPVRPPVVRLRIPGETVDTARGLRIRCAWARGYRRRRERGAGALPSVAWLDAARVKAAPALEVRAWRPGDRMRPWGLNGSRKVQDIFTDAGLDAGARRRAPILASGRTIVWIPGYRIAEGWGVPSRTAPALRLDALAWRGGARAPARSRRDRCPPGGGVVQSPA